MSEQKVSVLYKDGIVQCVLLGSYPWAREQGMKIREANNKEGKWWIEQVSCKKDKWSFISWLWQDNPSAPSIDTRTTIDDFPKFRD